MRDSSPPEATLAVQYVYTMIDLGKADHAELGARQEGERAGQHTGCVHTHGMQRADIHAEPIE